MEDFNGGSSPTFLVSGQMPGTTLPGSYLKPGRELRGLRSGPDWGLFSLESGGGGPHPDSIHLVVNPTQAARLIAAARSGSGQSARGDGHGARGPAGRASLPRVEEQTLK